MLVAVTERIGIPARAVRTLRLKLFQFLLLLWCLNLQLIKPVSVMVVTIVEGASFSPSILSNHNGRGGGIQIRSGSTAKNRREIKMSFSQSTRNNNNNNNPRECSCDVLVIGGGSAGLTAAKLASDTLQKDCILIEAERLGGAYYRYGSLIATVV